MSQPGIDPRIGQNATQVATAIATGVATHAAAYHDATTNLYLWDDFSSGSTGTGTLGDLGWNFTGGTTPSVNSEVNHPGIIRRDTSASSGTIALTRIKGGSSVHGWAESFDARTLFRLTQTDADTKLRVGLSSDFTSDTPIAAAYLEKLGTDTNWFYITRNASTETRTDSGVAASTGWVAVEIRRISSTVLGFKLATTLAGLAAATETQVTANLPTGVTAYHGWQLTNGAAASKTVDVDYWDLWVRGITR